jgi:hypothetical protein
MKTLYLRYVPDDVADALGRLARHDSMSVSAFAARGLAPVSRRADNQRLLGSLPDLGFPGVDVVAELEAEREPR